MSRRKTNGIILGVGGALVLAVIVLIIAVSIAEKPPKHRVTHEAGEGANVTVQVPDDYTEAEYREIAEHLQDDYDRDRDFAFQCKNPKGETGEIADEIAEGSSPAVANVFHDESGDMQFRHVEGVTCG